MGGWRVKAQVGGFGWVEGGGTGWFEVVDADMASKAD